MEMVQEDPDQNLAVVDDRSSCLILFEVSP
jgi:hypothetical protein